MQSGTVTRKKYRRVSYILRREEGRHRSGINALALDKRGDLLFTASRDGIARCWRTPEAGPKARSLRTYDGHTDWINDIALLSNEATIVTASSDTTIKLWGVSSEKCLHTLNSHTDYVKALTYSPDRGFLASGGLDKDICIWDVESSPAPVAQLSAGWGAGESVGIGAAPRKCSGHGESVYCLATNRQGSLILSGSPERVSAHAIGLVRLWDPRMAEQVGRLKGHTDNIRCLVLSADGTRCLTGGSDATIKLWDVGQRRCIQSLAVHTDSVWALAADEGFTRIVSGGRDQAVYCTDARSLDSTLLMRLPEPPLALALAPDGRSLWVATTASSVSRWEYEPAWTHELSAGARDRRQSLHRLPGAPRRGDLMAGRSPALNPAAGLAPPPWDAGGGGSPGDAGGGGGAEPVPLLAGPADTIPGLPATVRFDVLEDRRHALAEDSDGNLSVWHLPSATKVRELGRGPGGGGFEEQRRALMREVHAPAWCTVDCRLGSLTVHLDFPQAFGAELYSVDAELARPGDPDDVKVNVGFRVLRALFKCWRQARAQPAPHPPHPGGAGDDDAAGGGGGGAGAGGGGGGEEDEEDEGLDYDIPDQTVVVVSDAHAAGGGGGGGAGGGGGGGGGGGAVCARRVRDWGAADPAVAAAVPDWVAESLRNGLPTSERGEPVAEAAKVGFHLQRHPACEIKQLPPGKLNAPQILRCRKVLSYAAGKLNLEDGPGPVRGRPGPGPGEDVTEWLELVCNERVVPPETNLMTIRKFYARNSDELVLHYRWKEPPPPPPPQLQAPPQQAPVGGGLGGGGYGGPYGGGGRDYSARE